MDYDFLNARTQASLNEIRVRVAHALARHPLCRNVRFDIVSVLLTHPPHIELLRDAFRPKRTL